MNSFETNALGGLVVVAGCIAFLFLGGSDELTSRVVDEIFEFGHLPLFGVISIGVLLILARSRERRGIHVKAWGLTLVLGVLTEIIQIPAPERYFEVHDIVFDAIGAACFLAVAFAFERKDFRFRGMTAAASVIVVALATFPIFTAASDELYMKNTFPVLCSFETRSEISRWETKDSEISQSRNHATDGDFSLEVDLEPGIFPGVSTGYFVHDWSESNRLLLDIYHAGTDDLRLVIRINDIDHDNSYSDRFNKGIHLAPGPNRIALDLDEVENAPRSRKMDMEKISNICLFSCNLEENKTIWIDNLRVGK